MNEIPELWEIDRELGLRGSLIDFTAMAWHIVEPGATFVRSWHLDCVADHLEAVYRRDVKRLVINIPPGFSKSLMACVFWPTWAWIRDPGLRWIFGSYDELLTMRDADRSLKIIQSDWFRKRWGDRVIVGKNPPVSNIETTAAGWRFATSIKGKATGRHADIHVIDDPIKPRELTPTALKEVSEWRRGTLASRFRDPGRGAQVLIMQRLHEDDLAGEVVREGWTHLRLPMEYEPKVHCKTQFGEDKRTEEGELLCPDRFGPEAVVQLKRDMGGLVAAAQLQQRPTPAGGAVFKKEWFKFWKTLPARFDQLILSADCAFKGTDDSDYVVITVWGRIGADYYLVDRVRARMDFTETCTAIEALTRKHPKAVSKLIEDKANGPAVIQVLEKKISGLVAVNPEGGKEARANAVSPLFEAGNVYLPDPVDHPWVDLEYIPELLSFPMGRNDDQVDSTTQALIYLHDRTTNLRAAMEKIRARGTLY